MAAEANSAVREMQFRKVRADPSSYYASPRDVVTDDRFDTSQKVGILKQWGEDLLKLDPEVSGAEQPRSETEVKEVAQAIEELGADPGDLKSRSQ
ncbi:MAG: hypothetical protein ACLFWF_03050 [Alphaproteobacteria bacterium]